MTIMPPPVLAVLAAIGDEAQRMDRSGAADWPDHTMVHTGTEYLQRRLIALGLQHFVRLAANGTDPKTAAEQAITELHHAITTANAGLETTMRLYTGIGDATIWHACRRVRTAAGSPTP